jgi:uncharacterized membrane protein
VSRWSRCIRSPSSASAGCAGDEARAPRDDLAVNVGGCVVPVGLVLYEPLQLATWGAPALWAVLIAGILNIGVCYFLARPV